MLAEITSFKLCAAGLLTVGIYFLLTTLLNTSVKIKHKRQN